MRGVRGAYPRRAEKKKKKKKKKEKKKKEKEEEDEKGGGRAKEKDAAKDERGRGEYVCDVCGGHYEEPGVVARQRLSAPTYSHHPQPIPKTPL